MYLIEDVMLDTWEIMLKNMHTVENHPNPEGWIIKAAKYNMWKALKKQQNQWKKETDILEILDSYAADIAEQDEHFYDMYKEVLSQEEMELLKFIYVYEVDYETTSKYLGIKPSACRKRAERIRKKLKKYYKNDKMDQ